MLSFISSFSIQDIIQNQKSQYQSTMYSYTVHTHTRWFPICIGMQLCICNANPCYSMALPLILSLIKPLSTWYRTINGSLRRPKQNPITTTQGLEAPFGGRETLRARGQSPKADDRSLGLPAVVTYLLVLISCLILSEPLFFGIVITISARPWRFKREEKWFATVGNNNLFHD